MTSSQTMLRYRRYWAQREYGDTMNQELIIQEIKDTLVRLEGTINIMKKEPEVVAYRKVQGIRDKMQGLLIKLVNDKKEEEVLVSKVREQCEQES